MPSVPENSLETAGSTGRAPSGRPTSSWAVTGGEYTNKPEGYRRAHHQQAGGVPAGDPHPAAQAPAGMNIVQLDSSRPGASYKRHPDGD